MSEHIWPPELTADAKCEQCGLPYNQFDTDEELAGCTPTSDSQAHPCACPTCKHTVAYADEMYCFGCEKPAFCQCGCGCGQ